MMSKPTEPTITLLDDGTVRLTNGHGWILTTTFEWLEDWA